MYAHVPSKQQQIYSSFHEQGTHYQTFLKNETIGLITPPLSLSFSLSHTHTYKAAYTSSKWLPNIKLFQAPPLSGSSCVTVAFPYCLVPPKHFSFCPVATVLDVVTVIVRPPVELVVVISLWSCFLGGMGSVVV